MSITTRTATDSGKETPTVSLLIGIILIIIGLTIQTTRFRATTITVGGLLTSYGLLYFLGELLDPYLTKKFGNKEFSVDLKTQNRWRRIAKFSFFGGIIMFVIIPWHELISSILIGLSVISLISWYFLWVMVTSKKDQLGGKSVKQKEDETRERNQIQKFNNNSEEMIRKKFNRTTLIYKVLLVLWIGLWVINWGMIFLMWINVFDYRVSEFWNSIFLSTYLGFVFMIGAIYFYGKRDEIKEDMDSR